MYLTQYPGQEITNVQFMVVNNKTREESCYFTANILISSYGVPTTVGDAIKNTVAFTVNGYPAFQEAGDYSVAMALTGTAGSVLYDATTYLPTAGVTLWRDAAATIPLVGYFGSGSTGVTWTSSVGLFTSSGTTTSIAQTDTYTVGASNDTITATFA